MEFSTQEFNIEIIYPELILLITAMFFMTTSAFRTKHSPRFLITVSLISSLFSLLLLILTGYGTGYGSMFFNDPIAIFSKALILISLILSLILIYEKTKTDNKSMSSLSSGLIFFSFSAMMAAVSSLEFSTIYMGMEAATIPFVAYLFCSLNQDGTRSYYRFIAFTLLSSSLIIFGLSFLYGLSGSTDIIQSKINIAITHLTFETIGVIIALAVVLILTGLTIKMSLPPFHKWRIKLFSNLPAGHSLIFMGGITIMLLVIFSRIFLNSLSAFHGPEMSPNDWGWLVFLVAVAAMAIPTVSIFRQETLLKMAGYFSITQVGFVLAGMAAMSVNGLLGASFFLFPFILGLAGLYGATLFFEKNDISIENLKGLGKKSPLAALIISTSVLSLSGLPGTAGYMGKYYIIMAIFEASEFRLEKDIFIVTAVVGVVSSVVLLIFSLKLIRILFQSAESDCEIRKLSPLGILFMTVAVGGILIFGLYPDPILKFAGDIPTSFGFITE